MSGGKRPGAGRPRGAQNKATTEIRSLAQAHGPAAVAELIRLAENAENEATRVSAIKELLDRGYGKVSQPITGENGQPIRIQWLTGS